MAELLTWQEKLAKGLPLSSLEETKADADFNFKERLREQKARKEFEALKNGAGRSAEPVEADDAEVSKKKGAK